MNFTDSEIIELYKTLETDTLNIEILEILAQFNNDKDRFDSLLGKREGNSND